MTGCCIYINTSEKIKQVGFYITYIFRCFVPAIKGTYYDDSYNNIRTTYDSW